jgi:hypothetical protein
MNRSVFLAGILMFTCAAEAPAEERDLDFVARATAATEKYQDQSVAILDGYRPIGRDFPGMGVHWVRIGILFDSKIEAEHPEFLTYISISGTPRLAGLAYAIPLLPGEQPPELPAGKEAWHDHFRSIDDETIVPHHQHPGMADSEPRLAMLHAWIWMPNPDGIFAADNWSLPYIRLGLKPDAGASRAQALALTLTSGGIEYFVKMVGAGASPSKKQQARIDQEFVSARDSVWRTIRENSLTRLTDIWEQLWKTIASVVGSRKYAELQGVLPTW